jgi:hypothetical protein
MTRAARTAVLAVYALSLGLLFLCPCGPDPGKSVDAHACCDAGPTLRAAVSDCCGAIVSARTPEAVVEAPLAVEPAPVARLFVASLQPFVTSRPPAPHRVSASPPSVLRI